MRHECPQHIRIEGNGPTDNAWPYLGGRTCEIFYYIATAYEALGDAQKAREFYRKAVDAPEESAWSSQRYYQGMAFRKLGDGAKAQALFSGLLESASEEADRGVDFLSKFGERVPLNVRRSTSRYLLALARLGLGDKERARSELKKAIDLDLNNTWARIALSRL